MVEVFLVPSQRYKANFFNINSVVKNKIKKKLLLFFIKDNLYLFSLMSY